MRLSNQLAAAVQQHQQGNLPQAMQMYQQVVQADPFNAEAHRLLSAVLRQMGRISEAVPLLERAHELRPQDAMLRGELGLTYLTVGRIPEAIEHIKAAAEAQPDQWQGWYHLGRAYTAAFEPALACEVLKKAYDLKPGMIDVWGALGVAYLNRGMIHRALKFLGETVKRKGQDVEYLTYYATALRSAGELDQAEEYFQKALALNPRYTPALSGLAQTYENKGDFARAARLSKEAFEAGHQHPTLVITHARILQRDKRHEEAEAILRSALERAGAHKQVRAALLLQLGAVLEARGEYDGAFAAYSEGNAQFPRTFDEKTHADFVARVRAAFSPERFAAYPRASNRSTLPLFIVGMPRSGTTLVEQILASHPAVFGAGELGDIVEATRRLKNVVGTDAGYPECLANATREHLDQLAEAYLARLREYSPSAERVTDKMPHNFSHLGMIALLFPASRVILCRRDARDNCLSCFTTQLSPAHAYAKNLADCAVAYRAHLELVAHYRSVLDIPVLEVRYEELVANHEEMSRKIIAFAGLEWDDACLRFWETRRGVATASQDQVRRPIYDSSIGRWKKFEKHLTPLLDGLAGVV